MNPEESEDERYPTPHLRDTVRDVAAAGAGSLAAELMVRLAAQEPSTESWRRSMNDIAADAVAVQNCIDACLRCYQLCRATPIARAAAIGGADGGARHLALMLNCADICRTASDFLLSGSDHRNIVCAVCATVCRSCAESCERMGGLEECAAACRSCAGLCMRMAEAPTDVTA
jgi:hypothetical protein